MRKLLIILGSALILLSCKKNENSSSDVNLNSDYLPMSIGNHWVYQEFEIKPNGTETPLQLFDSIYISKDTLIKGEKFFFCISKTNGVIIKGGFYRDSSSFLLLHKTDKNLKVFSENNFVDTLAKVINPEFTISIKMEKLNSMINVPSGNYDVLNSRGIVTFNPPFSAIYKTRYTKNYYAKGVGLVLFSYYYMMDSSAFERRLLRYKIN